ncbi:A-factor biosynthesis protein AfsA [Longimycelium tulufanense]|uniref:A-factor biosynthesis protein AfsA n=1 Tax=Longimycelium tulufanense TaxID=907463 RepID=A0A8J3CE99_9PSEU|nr:AfsA-related hotdog domain-containing protein [Longimycelium tulufanense]GGM52950.1 A-factor biosynthesis protein AfsA [Longimycelium tulufanense]
MSTDNTVYLVGDRFAEFARMAGARTFSAFVADLDSGALDGIDEPLVIRAGQGVGEYEVRYLRDALDRRGLRPDRVRLLVDEPALADRQDLHKGRADNVLVADLRQDGDAVYAASLRLHNDNELLVDLQNRAHVQGMVAIEASRQMFLAVTERFFLSRFPQRRYYIVINSMSTTFQNFLFPVQATLRLALQETELSDPARLMFKATVEIEQAGRPAAVTHVDYAAFDPDMIDEKERRRAGRALESVREPAAALA